MSYTKLQNYNAEKRDASVTCSTVNMSDHSFNTFDSTIGDNDSRRGPFSRRYSKTELSQRMIHDNPKDRLKNNVNVQSLSINKLKYDRVGLVGREKETETLQNSLRRMTTTTEQGHRKKELIFIKGYSGVGKSTLASTVEKSIAHTRNGIFVQGKFDQNNRDIPYSGISAAFADVCRQVENKFGSEKESSTIASISESISSGLGDEVYMLTKVIPELQRLIVSSSSAEIPTTDVAENNDFEAGLERWKYAFRVLTRVLSFHLSPIVMVLDDLQWADPSSLEMIDYLISDKENPNALMILGCFRSNEVGETHVLTSKMSELSEKKEKHEFNMTYIELGNLKVDDTNKIIMAMLSLDEAEETKGLAEICWNRTHGNPFYLIEFVTMLKDEGLLNYSLGILKWIFDEKAIEEKTMSTENVVDLLQKRMRKLPPSVVLLLQYAGCLGATFRLSTLELLWTKHDIGESRSESVPALLAVLEEEKFIEHCDYAVYRWVHDRVQEAAIALGDVGKLLFQSEIGSVLYHSLSEDELEKSLFDVADLINRGDIKRRREFAELNLRAAEKAHSVSAFQSGALYATHGIKHLENDKWDASNRQLTLRLHALAAEMMFALGRVEEMELHKNEILDREDCLVLEKIPLYKTHAHKLCNMELKYTEMTEFCVSVLKELDCKLVGNRFLLPIQAVSSLLRTVELAKKTPKEVFQKPTFRRMTDPKQQAAMYFLFRCLYAGYLDQNKNLLVLSTTKLVQWTLKYGVNEMSGPGFATLGLLTVAALQDFKTATYLAECSLSIKKEVNDEFSEATTVFTAYNFVLCWTKPLQSFYLPFKQSYTSGMKSGNIEYAMWALSAELITLPFMMGKPLGAVLEKCSSVASQAEEVKQQDQHVCARISWQMILNLSGQSDETKLLTGKAYDSEKFEESVMITSNARTLEAALLCFFGEWEEAAELAIQRGDSFSKDFPGFFFIMMETFLRGLAIYAMANKTGKRKYKRHANGVRKKIKSWLKAGNPNVQHYYNALSAEHAIMKKDYKTAEKQYRKAISIAARTGNMLIAALTSERYANFSMVHLCDEDDAKYRTGEAIRFYKAWGAEAKVQLLEESLKDLASHSNL